MTPAEKLILKKYDDAVEDEFSPEACIIRTSNLLGIPRERIAEVVKGRKRGR